LSDKTGFGVYVHVPFCVRRCDYCAFATWTDRFHLASRYVEACATQLRRLRSVGDLPPASSVFFGGGTPSLLEPAAIASILSEVLLQPGAEVTVECNPETVDEEKLRGYRDAGVNRISFGVQSMVPHVLDGLGRVHSVPAVRAAVDAVAAAGLGSGYSVDLIFGAASETVADWESTLKEVLAVDPAPAHVSAYALTVEPGTPLARDTARHPDPDDQADKYLLADAMLEDAGYEWYEISNWSKPGAECRHNQLYWAQGEYVGAGCAAHSHRIYPTSGSARRWWNVRTPDRYVSLVEAGELAEAGWETLDPGRRRGEELELALRTRQGVPEEVLPGWRDDPQIDGLVAPAGEGRLVLTRRGRLLANEVSLRLVP
jgi:putative oxygen-independent coproporphyrinogen III oxidase